jgi:hypothetical protein
MSRSKKVHFEEYATPPPDETMDGERILRKRNNVSTTTTPVDSKQRFKFGPSSGWNRAQLDRLDVYYDPVKFIKMNTILKGGWSEEAETGRAGSSVPAD